MNNFLATNIDEQHLAEFKASAIAEDIIELNFRSWNPLNENDLDEVFTLLVSEPKHRNNGTLAGRTNQQLANTLRSPWWRASRSGGWIFNGYKGVSVKPNSPRTDSEGKVIKYESPRGVGNQQIFIPRVCVRVGRIIATKIGQDAAIEYTKRTELRLPESEATGFWEWFLSKGFSLIITEGAKKSAALVSAGYAAIGINGVWGWGSNVKDMFGEVEKSFRVASDGRENRGENLKTLHPELEPFLNGREIVLAFDRRRRRASFPKAHNSLSRQLNRLAPDLEEQGIKVAYFTEGRKCTRVIYLEKVVKMSGSSAPSVPSADDLNADRGKSSHRDDLADDTRNADDEQTIEPDGIVCARTTQERDFTNFADDTTDANDRNTPSSHIDLENVEVEYEC